MTRPNPEPTKSALDRLRYSWRKLVVATIAAPMAVTCWIGWAFANSGVSMDAAELVCSRRPEFRGSKATPVQAHWEWFPPGIRCEADYGGAAGWRQFWAPSWWDMLIPTILLAAVGGWLLLATVNVGRRASAVCAAPRPIVGVMMIIGAEALAAATLIMPANLDGGIAFVGVPIALTLAAGLLVAARFVLSPTRTRPKATSS